MSRYMIILDDITIYIYSYPDQTNQCQQKYLPWYKYLVQQIIDTSYPPKLFVLRYYDEKE